MTQCYVALQGGGGGGGGGVLVLVLRNACIYLPDNCILLCRFALL